MTQDEVNEIIINLYDNNKDAFDDNIHTVLILFNNRFKSTLGRCSFPKVRLPDKGLKRVALIEFNTNLLQYEDRMIDVIIHEFAHALAGKEDIILRGHSKLWKQIAQALGGTGDVKV